MRWLTNGYQCLACMILAIAAGTIGSPPAVADEDGAVNAKARNKQCESRIVVSIAIKPDITATRIKSLAARGQREVIYNTAADDISSAIAAMIDGRKQEALRARWESLQNRTNSFDDWLAGRKAGL